MNNYLSRRNNDFNLFEGEDPFFSNFFNVVSKEDNLMRTDIKETESEFVVDVDVPGFNKNDIKISLDNKYLTITANKTLSDEDKKAKFIRRERFYGTCTRSYYVGDVSQDVIKASFNDGVLSITIPKEDYQKKEEKKYIAIN